MGHKVVAVLAPPAVADIALCGPLLLPARAAKEVAGGERLAVGARKRDGHAAVICVHQQTDGVLSEWIVDAAVGCLCFAGDKAPTPQQGIRGTTHVAGILGPAAPDGAYALSMSSTL